MRRFVRGAGRGASRGPVRRDANGDIIYSAGLRSLADLRDDDKAAAEEAAAQNGRPGYCGDRHLRAAAGGQYCAKFERPSSLHAAHATTMTQACRPSQGTHVTASPWMLQIVSHCSASPVAV